jgi:hypothetical protein
VLLYDEFSTENQLPNVSGYSLAHFITPHHQQPKSGKRKEKGPSGSDIRCTARQKELRNSFWNSRGLEEGRLI